MKKVININFQGQVIAIEESAYEMLKQYIERLTRFFSHEEGGDEIVNDIECRIAELFGNRLRHGISCITDEDVEAIITSIGRPEDFDSDYEEPSPVSDSAGSRQEGSSSREGGERRSLYRNSGDRILGGVCSGLAHYFRSDPVWFRMIFVLFFGFLFWVYIVLWIVLKPKVLETNVTKRLYRNPNDRFLGGVCGGIAAYFKIDSWIPRLVFLLPFLLNLIGMISFFPLNFLFDEVDFSWNINMGVVVVYIVFWIIIPEAKSVKQKLEMMGEEEYIRSIREKVSDNVASARSRGEGETATPVTTSCLAAERGVPAEKVWVDEMPPLPQPESLPTSSTPAGRPSVAPSSERSGCLQGLILLLKIIFFSFVGLFALVLTGLCVAMFFAGAQLMPLKSLFVDPGQESTMLLVSLVLLIGVPVLSILIWIVRRVMKARSRPLIGVISVVFWFGGLVTAGILTARVADKFSEESTLEQTFELTPVNGSRLYLDMQPYNDDYSEFRLGFGMGSDLDELPFTNVNRDSLLFRSIHLHIRNSSDSLFHVRTLAASSCRELRGAKADLEEFRYEISQQDSLLYLPEFLMVPISQGYRNQSITVEISVPPGKTVEVSDVLNNYRSQEPPSVVRKRIRSYTRTYFSVEPSQAGEVVTGKASEVT
ncbi:MAG: PspC domain-containing protein [Proteiniphilum sp.]|nr:PspC domain-containing protein [Proteiniphilum sp.]MDD4458566.1 PspC domain-containing protein [Proteiniphilum sp.]